MKSANALNGGGELVKQDLEMGAIGGWRSYSAL